VAPRFVEANKQRSTLRSVQSLQLTPQMSQLTGGQENFMQTVNHAPGKLEIFLSYQYARETSVN